MVAVKKGKMCGAFKGVNSITVYWTLYPVKVVRGIQEDLFSIIVKLSKGGVLSRNNRKNIVLKYKDGQNKEEKTREIG